MDGYVDVPLFTGEDEDDDVEVGLNDVNYHEPTKLSLEQVDEERPLQKAAAVEVVTAAGPSSNAIERIAGTPVTTLQAFEVLRRRRLEMSVKSALKVARLSKRREKKRKKNTLDHPAAEKKLNSTTDSSEKRWREVSKFLDVNSHIAGPVGHGVGEPKSGMEVRVNRAIAVGDVDKADQLSDQLAAREFGARVAKAFAAKRYLDEKEEDKKRQLMKAKLKLHWGFDAKERWEMKGNM